MPIDPQFLQPGGALASPLLRRVFGAQAAQEGLPPGARVGPYRVERELGRGGMAVVYLAQRADGEFEQTVALKLVRPDHDSPLAQELLRQERQILAGLHHPRIARLLDGGRCEDATLWFALEFVQGVRIDRYCRERRLPLRARLRLFTQVCDAVQFAHTRLLIHRDIKPANILVAQDGNVKLLDFGIAQLLTPGVQDAPVQRALTPGYASPEQMRGEPVTTASDVYQLGRLLQSMLTEDAAGDDSATATAHTRLSPADNAAALPRAVALPGDVGAIVAKALREQPLQRYATAAELQTDVEDFLAQRPVRARNGGGAYRAGRFLQRHRWAALAASAVLIAFMAMAVHFTFRVQAERDEARRSAEQAAAEARRANQVTEFLLGMFKVADPDVNRGDRLTATQILARGAQQAQQTLATQPALLAGMLGVIGEVYTSLGDYPRAKPLLEQALALRREHTASALELAHNLRQLAYVEHKLSAFAAAQDLLRQADAALGALESAQARSERAAILDLRGLAQKHLGDLDGALASHQQALDVARAAGDEEREVAIGNHLGLLLYALDRWPEAQRVHEQTLALALRRSGEKHAATLDVRENLAMDLSAQGQFDAAITQMRAALQIETELLGAEHPEHAQTLNMLANIYMDARRFDDAIDIYMQALAITQRVLGADSDQAASIENNIGASYGEKADYAQALDHLQRAAAARRKINGADHYETAQTEAMVATTLFKLGRGAEAERLARAALATLRRSLPPEHRYIGVAQATLGEILLAKKDREEARGLLEAALRNARQSKDEDAIRSVSELLQRLSASPAH
jgi:tetratricopeptide (TPR) repeat protein